MRITRILVASLAVTVFNFVVATITCGGIFSWVYQLEPTQIWKPMQGAPGAMFLIGSFVLSIVWVYVYAFLNKAIPDKNKLIKGFKFGLCVWAVGTLPGMFATYTYMTVAPTVVIYGTIVGLIQMPVQGMIIAKLYGE